MGLTLAETMKRLTYREFLVRMKIKELEENTITPDHWYLMQIAREIACVLHPDPKKVKLEDFKLKLVSPSEQSKKPKKKFSSEEIKSKVSMWSGLVGLINGKRNRNSKTGHSPSR